MSCACMPLPVDDEGASVPVSWEADVGDCGPRLGEDNLVSVCNEQIFYWVKIKSSGDILLLYDC